MPFLVRLIITLAFVCSYLAHSQQVGTIQEFLYHGWVKAENGLIISWQGKAEDATTAQVSISDIQGHQITKLKLWSIVPAAGSVYVYDVSARPGMLIAVAADYISKEGYASVRPAAALLLFDFDGHLISFHSLAPWRDIERLEVDEESNIWTLASIADESGDPASYSMVVEYTASGTIAKELLPRNLFPYHAKTLRRNSSIGYPEMGYDSKALWFWLPGSNDFVTMSTPVGKPAITNISPPSNDVIPVKLVRDSSGALVGQFREGLKAHPAYFKWSTSTKSWVRFTPGSCDGGWLVGFDNNQQVYLTHENGAVHVCVFSHP